jgi:hypothetical protein
MEKGRFFGIVGKLPMFITDAPVCHPRVSPVQAGCEWGMVDLGIFPMSHPYNRILVGAQGDDVREEARLLASSLSSRPVDILVACQASFGFRSPEMPAIAGK